jgi:hypothetical protein
MLFSIVFAMSCVSAMQGDLCREASQQREENRSHQALSHRVAVGARHVQRADRNERANNEHVKKLLTGRSKSK